MTFKPLLILFTSFLVSFSANVWAQQDHLFTRVYGGHSYDVGREVIQTPDEGYLVAGTTGSFGLESGQILLLKTDLDGYLEWRRYYGGEYADRAESMQMAADGNLIIAGSTETVENSYQFYALKMDTDGDTIWTRSYGGPAWDLCKQVAALPDGGFALFGQTFETGNGDFYLVRIDADGDTLWTKTYGGSDLESGESIALAWDGGFYLAGHTQSFGEGKNDMYVVRTDDVGDTLWTKTFGGVEDDFCFAVAATADSGYVLAGGSFNYTPDKSDFILRREDGNESWIKTENKPGNCYYEDVIIEPNTQNVTAVGHLTMGEFGQEDGRILRYGVEGTWNGVAKTHGSAENDRFYDVKLCSDFGYVMVGQTAGYLNRFDDVWLVRADQSGFTVPSELAIDEIELNGETFSVSVGPNPFFGSNPSLFIPNYQTIAKALDESIQIEIFNALGQRVAVQPVDSEQVELHLGETRPGIYSYQLLSGRKVLATGKVVKL